MTSTNANTMPVVCNVSLRVGQTTFLVSSIDSWAKAKNSLPGAVVQHTSDRRDRPPSTRADARNQRALIASSKTPTMPAIQQKHRYRNFYLVCHASV